MKKLFLCLIILRITVTTANAQGKNELRELNLKGKVKSVRETSYQAVQKQGTVEKGKRKMEAPKYYRDFYVVLNEKGNKIEKTEYNSDGSSFVKLIYQYDGKGNTVSEDRYNGDGSLAKKNQFTYNFDDHGNMIEKNWIQPNGSLGDKTVFKYDDKGNIIEMSWFNEDGSSGGKGTRRCDEKGNMVEGVYFKPDGKIDWRYTYRYDEKGNRVEENIYKGEKFIIKYFRKFDEYGNETEIDWCKENGKPYRKYSSKFEYDSNGNWIRQTQFKKENKPTYILERELTYFSQ